MPLEFESTKTRAEDIFVGLVTDEYYSRQLLGKTLGDAIERLERVSSEAQTPPETHLREQMEAVYQVRNLIRLAVSEIILYDERVARFAGDNLHVLPSGARVCRTCQRLNKRALKQRWKDARTALSSASRY